MYNSVSFIIIIILVLLYLLPINKCYKRNNKEGFNTTNRIRETDGFSWFSDPMFLILNYFENDVGGYTGWEKCKLVCPGNCVEFGLSGHSFCFDKESEDVLRFPTFRDETISGGFTSTPK